MDMSLTTYVDINIFALDYPAMDTSLDATDPLHIIYTRGPLVMEVFGGLDLADRSSLKVTIKASSPLEPVRTLRDTLNCYVNGQFEAFVHRTSDRLAIASDVVRDALDTLVSLLEKYRIDQIQAMGPVRTEVIHPEQEMREAMAYLQAPALMQRLNTDLGSIGLVGEESNRQLTYLVMTSRKLAFPLHLVNFGRTGTGKSALLELVAQCMPAEDRLELTSTSDKAFYHFSEEGLQHKLILIQDLFGITKEVLYQIRELQSKRKLTRAFTLKDRNGNFQSSFKVVQGPVCVVASTTAKGLFSENANRAIEVSMNEDVEQDARVLERQRMLAAGLVDLSAEEAVRARLRAIQRLLHPLPVKNPFALQLALPCDVQHQRRTNAIYLGLIEVIALLHQYQRKREAGADGREHVVCQIEDIRIADQLMTEVLIQKADLLNRTTRRFFESLKTWSRTANTPRFNQRQVAVGLRLNASRIKRYFAELLDYDLLSITGGDRYRNGFEYEVADAGEYERLRGNVGATMRFQKRQGLTGTTVGRSRIGPLKTLSPT
jgi:DNA primase